MEELSPFFAADLAKYLTRRECIILSWCSKTMHLLMDSLCHLRLTERQAEVVKKIIGLKPDVWKEYINLKSPVGVPLAFVSKIDFPQEFIVSSGPSTGKTAIVLYMMGYYYRHGIHTFVSVPLKLAVQWQTEAEKFSKQFGLPPFCIVHPQFCPDWQARLRQEHLPIVPDSVVRVRPSMQKTSTIFNTQKTFLACREWRIGFVDEASSVVYAFLAYSKKAANRNHRFHMVCLNASKSAKDSLANYAKDEQLGKLPDFEVIVEQSSSSLRAHSTISQPNLPDVEQFIDRYRGKKTLLLCDTSKLVARPGSMITDWVNSFALRPFFEPLERRGFINICRASTDERAFEMKRFAESSESAIVAPFDYMLRGWNLKCDTVLVINCRKMLSPAVTMQLLGRVLRVESPFQTVRLCIQQNHPITANELACHALAASGLRSTHRFTKDAHWFAESPKIIKLENGKRQKLDDDLVKDKSIQGRLNLFSVLFPEDVKFISEISPTRLVVKSKPEIV